MRQAQGLGVLDVPGRVVGEVGAAARERDVPGAGAWGEEGRPRPLSANSAVDAEPTRLDASLSAADASAIWIRRRRSLRPSSSRQTFYILRLVASAMSSWAMCVTMLRVGMRRDRSSVLASGGGLSLQARGCERMSV